MGLFDGLFNRKHAAPQLGENDALLAVLKKYPDAWLCLTPKTKAASKLISSAVVLDSRNRVGVCFVTTDMLWLSNLEVRCVSTHSWVDITRIDPPLLILHGESRYVQHQFTAARIVLTLEGGMATYVATPWWPEDFELVCAIDRWIIWSFTNEMRRDAQHYWGFGDFGSTGDFEKVINRIVDGT